MGDLGLIPGLGRSPKGGYGNPFQYSCLENPQLTEDAVHRVANCWTRAAKHAQDIQVVLVIMNPTTNAGDTGDMGSILGWKDPQE